MAIPIPNLTLSTGPQVADGRSGGSFAPSFGGDFFGRSSGGASVDRTSLIVVAGIAAIAFLLVTKRIKI